MLHTISILWGPPSMLLHAIASIFEMTDLVTLHLMYRSLGTRLTAPCGFSLSEPASFPVGNWKIGAKEIPGKSCVKFSLEVFGCVLACLPRFRSSPRVLIKWSILKTCLLSTCALPLSGLLTVWTLGWIWCVISTTHQDHLITLRKREKEWAWFHLSARREVDMIGKKWSGRERH